MNQNEISKNEFTKMVNMVVRMSYHFQDGDHIGGFDSPTAREYMEDMLASMINVMIHSEDSNERDIGKMALVMMSLLTTPKHRKDELQKLIDMTVKKDGDDK